MDAHPDRAGEWWSKDTIALVTGANQGIGLQLVRDLAKRGLTTIITSRDESKGLKSQEALREEGLPQELLVYHQLDITSPKSVEELALWISRSYGSIDILINNAGVGALQVGNLEQAKRVVDTNYYGTKRMIEAMVPHIKPGGRIINVSSKAGDLSYLRNDWKTKLEDISTLTPGNIDEMAQDFLRAVESLEIQAKGWPCLGDEMPSAPPEMLAEYSLSKIALNSYSRIIAGELASDKQIFLNSMCPGATSTSMTGFRGHSVDIGADTAVFLALLPPGTPDAPMPHGKFFVNRKDVGFSQIPLFVHGKTYANLKESYADRIKHNK